MRTDAAPQEESEGRGGVQRVPFTALVFAHAVNDMSSGFFAPLAPLVAAKLGLSLTMIGTIMAIRSVFNSVPQPLFGWLIDRYPGRGWLLATPLVVGFFRSGFGLATGFWSLTGMLSVAALGGACFHPAAAACARELSASRRGLVMATYVAAGRIGQSAGPIIALTLVSWLGFEGLVAATGFYGLSMAALYYFPPRPQKREEAPRARAGSKESRESWGAVGFLYGISILRNTVTINLYAFLPLYFAARGESLWTGGAALTLILISGGAGSVAGGWLSDWMGRKKVIVFSSLASFPLLLLFLQADGTWKLLLILPLGLMLHASMGVSVAYAQELLPGRPALAASLLQGGNWFISGLTLTATGALGDYFGLQAALHVLLVLLFAEFFLSLLLPGTGRRIVSEGV